MWAVAREYGFTDEEFGKLSMAQFWRLFRQRQLAFQKDCYLQGMVAATLLNANRATANDRVFDAFDFVGKRSRTAAEIAEDEAADRLDAVVLHFRNALVLLPPDKVQQAIAEIPDRLSKLGFSAREVAELQEEILRDNK